MTSHDESREKGEEEEEGEPRSSCLLLFGAFSDDACARGKRVTIPHASLAPLLFGGTLPPSSTTQNDHCHRPPPPFRRLASASVAADGFALVAAADGLGQCQYGRPGAVWNSVEVEGLPCKERFSAVAAGDFTCLALSAEDGSVFAWSRRRGRQGDDNEDGTDTTAKCVLGPRLDDDNDTTTPLHRLPIAAIAAARRHCLAVAKPPHAAAFAWGDSSRGQCAVAPGQGSGASGSFVPKPRLIEALGGVVCGLCAAGDWHSLVASADGASVFEFGGEGGSSPVLVDHLSAAKTSIVALAAGGKHSVALDADGRVFCWGDGGWGQRVEDGSGGVAHSVVAGWRHTAVVLK
jgi:hypothetical protein